MPNSTLPVTWRRSGRSVVQATSSPVTSARARTRVSSRVPASPTATAEASIRYTYESSSSSIERITSGSASPPHASRKPKATPNTTLTARTVPVIPVPRSRS
ncbi:MAG: hypothetical protein M3340_09750 [Actinomycetota bacterium]|nr:hypothetical protein [Actinomycetota bacterium]